MLYPSRRALVAGLAAAPALLIPRARAQSAKLRMILNWRYQGPQAWFFIAEDEDYFKENGVEIAIDQGDGSAAAVAKVASGAYDVGFGDVNAVIQLAALQPHQAPLGVQMLFNQSPFTIAVRKDGLIKQPKDLEGKTLGAPVGDSALKLFPAFARISGIDISKVKILNMAPNLREIMLARGQVDGVFGFVNTIRFSARLANIDVDNTWKFIKYGDYGMDLYSNCVIVSRRLAEENPGAVRGLVRAINLGVVDTIADPKDSIEHVRRREPLINPSVEYDRLIATLHDEMNHPEIARIGLGDADDERLKKSVDIIVEAAALPRSPEPRDVFDRAFLPPFAERPHKVIS